MAIRHTFTAYERLKREQHIDTLFRNGKAFSVFPVRFIYTMVPRGSEVSPVRVGFSVSKKKFRRAVQRNRVKRLLREAWRLNKHQWYAAIPPGSQLHLFLIFTDVKLPEFDTVRQALIQGMDKLMKNIDNA